MNFNLRSILKNYGIVIAFILICVLLSFLSPVFRTLNNFTLILRQTSIYGIMAVGMTFVILTGGIDLSVGSVLALSGAICAGMLKSGMPLPVVLLVTLAVGVGCGLFNGLAITVGSPSSDSSAAATSWASRSPSSSSWG
jgi:ribose/xylose/arabinose/galactoside ABC-type transport system permease subunit